MPSDYRPGMSGETTVAPDSGVRVPAEPRDAAPLGINGTAGSHGSAKPRRNLVMFMPDQLRYDSLGCTGNPVIKTPWFDELAAAGTLFSNCFAQASVCTQSRCSMFTGQYLHTSAHRSLEYLLHDHEDNLFRCLKNAGYHVCSIGPRGDLFAPGATELSMNEFGWIEGPPGLLDKRAAREAAAKERTTPPTLDERLFYKGILTEAEAQDYDKCTVDSALEWLKSNPPEPFCLFLPLIYPHPPFNVEDPYFSRYQDMDLPPRVKLSEKTGYEPKFLEVMRREHGLERCTEEDWHKVKATYYGMINRLDDQLGSLLDLMKEPLPSLDGSSSNLWDRTYTMMYTDHGEYLGDSDMVEKWPSGLHEVLVRDPLMIAGPDLPSGQVNDALCEMVDIVPTILELLGIPETYPHSGLSLVNTIKSNSSRHKEYAFSEGGFLLREEPQLELAPFPYDRKAAMQHENTLVVGRAISIRNKDYAYTYRLYEPAELFDRKADPGEAHNIAEDPKYVQTIQKFEKAILRWMVETSDYVPWQKDPRFPKVDLESTKDQVMKRVGLARQGGKFNM